MPANKVTQLLEIIISKYGKPQTIRMDNGTEFTSHVFKDWAKENGIALLFIQPGKPAQNGLIERFNRTYREDILDMNLFSHLQEVKQLTQAWLKVYNEERPHESLAGLSPTAFAEMRKNKTKLENSIFK